MNSKMENVKSANIGLSSHVPQLLIGLFNKYNWVLSTNKCYQDEIVFKYKSPNQEPKRESNKSDWYIYISKVENKYYISIPLKTLGYNMKIYCGDASNNKTMYYTIYDILEEKLQYLRDV
jgi:hypothetical protein